VYADLCDIAVLVHVYADLCDIAVSEGVTFCNHITVFHPAYTDRLIDRSGSLKRELNVYVADFPHRMVEKCYVLNMAEVGLHICCILFNDTLNRPVINDSE